MSSHNTGTQLPGRLRVQLARWAVRLLIAFILSLTIILTLFSSGAVSQ